jgi:hypothetical protein
MSSMTQVRVRFYCIQFLWFIYSHYVEIVLFIHRLFVYNFDNLFMNQFIYSHFNRIILSTTQTFLISDLDISKGQLELFLDQYSETPWKVRTIHYTVLTPFMNY